MHPQVILGSLFLLFAAVLTLALVVRRRRIRALEAVGVRTTGLVTHVDREDSGFSVVVEFVAEDGNQYSSFGGFSSFMPTEGQEVEVVYDPRNPLLSEVEPRNRGHQLSGFFVVAIIGVLGVVLLVIEPLG